MDKVKRIEIILENGEKRTFSIGAFITVIEDDIFKEVQSFYCIDNDDELNGELNQIIFGATDITAIT